MINLIFTLGVPVKTTPFTNVITKEPAAGTTLAI
jgi:hypothetical protein